MMASITRVDIRGRDEPTSLVLQDVHVRQVSPVEFDSDRTSMQRNRVSPSTAHGQCAPGSRVRSNCRCAGRPESPSGIPTIRSGSGVFKCSSAASAASRRIWPDIFGAACAVLCSWLRRRKLADRIIGNGDHLLRPCQLWAQPWASR
jgi:hypothetical protein